jgi:hypothetical protein
MAINYTTPGAFADHYRTGKFTDLGLVAKDGTQFNVHKLVVCSHSPVLDAQTAEGATILDTGDDATSLSQMIEWMYGIDDEHLLIDRKSVGEVISLGSSEVYGEILTLSDLAGIAEKVCQLHVSYALYGRADNPQYQLPKLKYQAIELVGQLVENTTSLQCLLEAVLHLAPENAKGTIQKILAARALDLTQAQDDTVLASQGENTLSHRQKHRPTPLSSTEDATENKERETSVNIDRSALRSATGSLKHARQDDTDSDTPLKQQGRKRKKKEHESHDSPASNVSKSRPTRRNEPFRISTALPENDPPKGPHCHCKASSTDPTLLACTDCGNKYHPRCVGKGRYSKSTYYGNPQEYMLKDLDLFEDRPFKCGDCEEGFFGGR